MRHSLRVYKNEKLSEMKGEDNSNSNLRTDLEKKLYKNVVPPKPFSVVAKNLVYPTPTHFKANQFYKASSMEYGSNKPTDFEIPPKYYPRVTKFTVGFCGGMFKNNSLQTIKPISRICGEFDGYTS